MQDEKKNISMFGHSIDEDERLGTSLARVIKEREVIGDCLTDEDMSALIEGNIPNPEKNALLKHIASCDTCFEIYQTLSELNAEEEISPAQKKYIDLKLWERDEEPIPIATKRNMYKSLALAASVLIVAVGIYIFYQSTEIPKTSKQFFEMDKPHYEEMAQPSAPTAEPSTDAILKDEKPVTKQSPAVSSRDFFAKGKSMDKRAKTVQKDETTATGGAVQQEELKKEQADKVSTEDNMNAKPIRSVVPGTQRMMEENQAPAPSPTEKKKEEGELKSAANVQPVQVSYIEPGIEKRVENLQNKLDEHKTPIQGKTLEELFTEAVVLSQKIGNSSMDYTQSASNIFYESERKRVSLSKKSNSIRENSPFVSTPAETRVTPVSAIMSPNIEYFLGKSIPGTVEYRFFSLALSGWCDSRGIFRPGNMSGDAKIGKDAQKSASLLKQWEILSPELKGIYKEIADSTIEFLKIKKK